MPEFDFSEPIPDTSWIIEGLIPAGQLGIVLAQAGVGKSLVVEDMAIHIVFELPFCGFNTIGGDVLIIDQDTPSDRLKARLQRFALGTRKFKKYTLFIESMAGLTLANSNLFNVINRHPSVKLVVIDSLHSICEGINTNNTSDMGSLARLKHECLREDLTILINHHITEKVSYPIEALMVEDTHKLSMGSSAIIQQADTYYIVGADASNGVTEKIYVRPVPKRLSLSSKPLILQMLQIDNGGETLGFLEYYEPDYSDIERDLLILFKAHQFETSGTKTVKETYEALGHRHGEKQVRAGLMSLEKKGLLVLSKHAHDLFKYKLP